MLWNISLRSLHLQGTSANEKQTNSVGKLPTLRAIQPTNRCFISCRANTFICLSNVVIRLCGARSLIHWVTGVISGRQADNSKPSTIKKKKAWCYTFSTYFYQTWCLSRVKMAQILILNITYCVCLCFKVTNMATARNFEVIFDKLNTGIMFIWVVNSSQKQTEVVEVVVDKYTRNILKCSFLPRGI
jgi:hypothetical protein